MERTTFLADAAFLEIASFMATPAALGYVSYPPPLARKRTDGSPPNPAILDAKIKKDWHHRAGLNSEL
ncbi:hypothetical protein [Sphingomonas aerolata]|uniref:hypothetical protein n=1 Tax=Sphingomonas aerolata TaxID=185951 RepID=UPI00335F9968